MEAEFVRLQRAFTRHLRDPDRVAPPGDHEARRMAIYRHAVFANVAGLMADNYPRVRVVMNDQRWQAMLRDYIIRHQSRASAFVDVPREFLDYLEHEREVDDDPPFLRELAHFDWMETLIGADQRTLELDRIERDGDLLAGIPVANPIMTLVRYAFPVHAIDADYQPDAPPLKPTRIAAFRDPDNLYGFLDLNDAAARLLETIMQAPGLSGAEILAGLARDMPGLQTSTLTEAGSIILNRMRQRGAILGTLRSTNS